MEILRDSTNILGAQHPLTCGVRASMKVSFEEQLDWTLDDIPDEIFEVAIPLLRPDPGTRA